MWAKAGRILRPASSGVTAFPDDGMTLEWVGFFGGATGNLIPYFMLGGEDMEVKFGTFQLDASGTTVETGVGFQPDAILFLWASPFSGFIINNVTHTTGFGAAAAGSGQACAVTYFTYLIGGNPTRKYIDGDRCIAHMTSGGLSWTAQVSSYDADGFTLSNDAAASGQFVCYIAIRDPGGTFEVGTAASPTSTGVQTIVTADDPKGVIIFGNGVTALDAIQADHSSMFGVASVGADGSGVIQHTVQVVEKAASTATGTRIVSTAANQFIDFSGGWTMRQEASISFGNNQFDLNWTTVDGSARQYAYFVAEGGEIAEGNEGLMVFFLGYGMVTTEGIFDIDGRNSHAFATTPTDMAAVGTFGERDFANAGSMVNYTGSGAGIFPGFSFPSQTWRLAVLTPFPGGIQPIFRYNYPRNPFTAY